MENNSLLKNNQDIKYKGFLNYQTLRLIAWVCFAISQLVIVFKLGKSIVPEASTTLDGWIQFAKYVGVLPLPLFLLANFTQIFGFKGTYKKLLTKYAVLWGLMALLFIFLCSFYLLRFTQRFIEHDPLTAYKSISKMLNDDLHFSLSMNVFVDMFMCVLAYFFLTYVPKKKIFEGKKRYWFRALVAIPIIYELIFTVLKGMVRLERITVPYLLLPLFPNKAIFVYLAFMFIMLIFKARVKRMKSKGMTEEDILDYQKTNRHALNASITISIVFIVMSCVDILINHTIIGIMINTGYVGDIQGLVDKWGFGGAFPLMFAVPFVMLFDYRAVPKFKNLDPLVPIIGIGLTVLVVFEGLFELIIKTK